MCANSFNQADAQIIAVADPIERQDLEAFYYKTMSGRLPLKDEIEKHFSEKTPNYHVADYEDFRVMLEKEKAIDAILCATPGPLARLRVRQRHASGQTCLLRKAAHPQRLGSATDRRHREGNRGSHAARQPGSLWRFHPPNLRDHLAGAIGDVREVHAWTAASRWNKKILGGKPPEEPVRRA